MEGTPQSRCPNCKFAVKNPEMELRRVGTAVDLSTRAPQPATYSCRRYPPQFALTQIGPVPQWPNMLAEHWCGEFSLGSAVVRQ